MTAPPLDHASTSTSSLPWERPFPVWDDWASGIHQSELLSNVVTPPEPIGATSDSDLSGQLSDPTTAYSGPASQAAEIVRRRRALAALAFRFFQTGIQIASDDFKTISSVTLLSFLKLLAALPMDAPLPRILPDGEGALVLQWENASGIIAGIVDGTELHLIERAGTPRATHHPVAVLDFRSASDIGYIAQWLLSIVTRS